MKFNFKILFLISLAINILILLWLPFHLKSVGGKFEEQSKNYPLLSQRIFVEDPRDFLTNFSPLRNALQVYISENGKEDIQVYFEYLPSGASVGVNDREVHEIVSLIKVPVAMEVYKKIEEGKIAEGDILTVQEVDLDKRFGELWKRGAGTKVTVREAVELSLQDSDNTASNMLLRTVGLQSLEETFTNLEVEFNSKNGIVFISPKNYSSVFRTLYLSSYLKLENSQKILDILTRTKFKDFLEAGVPSGTKVAHKIGNYVDKEGDGLYSDCGNIYLSNRPYFLCIMVTGSNKYATEHISEISRLVATFIEQVGEE